MLTEQSRTSVIILFLPFSRKKGKSEEKRSRDLLEPNISVNLVVNRLVNQVVNEN